MADRREDERATFQFIDEVQNCLDLWEVSSAGYNDAKKISRRSSWTSVLYAKRVRFLLIYGFVQTLINNISVLSVSSLAINIQQNQDASGNSS